MTAAASVQTLFLAFICLTTQPAGGRWQSGRRRWTAGGGRHVEKAVSPDFCVTAALLRLGFGQLAGLAWPGQAQRAPSWGLLDFGFSFLSRKALNYRRRGVDPGPGPGPRALAGPGEAGRQQAGQARERRAGCVWAAPSRLACSLEQADAHGQARRQESRYGRSVGPARLDTTRLDWTSQAGGKQQPGQARPSRANRRL
ncbi:uncharacterized protein PSFLO_00954 [Pseudozyma flocculosa]|uniref:Uncharacterized protein n=1 Tax=Pseudozyma flocculosa TaxID=84751 RepID=A0A5C3ET06_9BASI|nr:uncharacterized protein PSFLO_00954 [Pseudozyma flocculosa]